MDNFVDRNVEIKTVDDFVIDIAVEQFDRLCAREKEVAERLDELTSNPIACMLRIMANDMSDLEPLRAELQAIREYKKFMLFYVKGLSLALVVREAESIL